MIDLLCPQAMDWRNIDSPSEVRQLLRVANCAPMMTTKLFCAASATCLGKPLHESPFLFAIIRFGRPGCGSVGHSREQGGSR
jgi:hypothetical protein